jgi:kynurenine formamidase
MLAVSVLRTYRTLTTAAMRGTGTTSHAAHTGTQFDAPIHWITGCNLPNNSTDTVPADRLLGAACVIDYSKEAAADPNFLRKAQYKACMARFRGVPGY